jgi:hypothetical protein
MAGITLIRTVNMVGTLAAGCHAVMAIGAVTHERGMIWRAAAQCRYPCSDAMALVAFQRCLDMRRAFTLRDDIVVAAGTHTQHFTMIYSA